MGNRSRTPLLQGQYHQYLADQDPDAFGQCVSARYTIGTLERLATMGDRMTRRAAVFALGLLADYQVNATLGRALLDKDRGVRLLAENALRAVWCRVGPREHCERLEAIVGLNNARRFERAIEQATALIADAPWMAETWNQRALALFSVGRYSESIRDGEQALEINPYHFGAATGMGQCHLQLKNRRAALECFRRALKLNPSLEGVRAHVLYLQRTLKNQE